MCCSVSLAGLYMLVSTASGLRSGVVGFLMGEVRGERLSGEAGGDTGVACGSACSGLAVGSVPARAIAALAACDIACCVRVSSTVAVSWELSAVGAPRRVSAALLASIRCKMRLTGNAAMAV